MPLYRYKARGLDGKIYRGKINAEDDRALFAVLGDRDLYCCGYSKAEKEGMGGSGSVKARDIPLLCRQMAAMLSAGVSLSEILWICCCGAGNRNLRSALLEVREGVHQGLSLSEAMERGGGRFPRLLVYMMQSGEASGRLGELLKKTAEYYSREEELNAKVRTAMTYPVILLAVTAAACIFMLTEVLPQFMTMLEEQQLPLLTRIMIAAGLALRSHGFVYAAVLLCFAALFAGILMIPSVRLKTDRAVLHIPIIGRLLKTIDTSRFSSTFSVLYGSGTGILESLGITSRIMKNTYVRKKLEEAQEYLKDGEMLSQALRSMEIFEPALIAMVAAGEESGTLEEVLREAGSYYEKEAERSIEQMIALLEPVMILFMALVVGSVVLSIMVPVFTMYSSML